MIRKERVKISLNLPKLTLERLDILCAELNLSRTQIMNMVLNPDSEVRKTTQDLIEHTFLQTAA